MHAEFLFGPFRLDTNRHVLLRADDPVCLSSRALNLLTVLATRPGEVITKDELIACAWPDAVVEESNLRVQIAALRKALADGPGRPAYVATVPGRGYRFIGAVSRRNGDTASSTRAPPSNHLPNRLTRVIGRAAAVASLCERLQRSRFFTIVGCGGVGKTTVALAVARQLVETFADPVCFIDLAPIAEPGLVACALASALSLPLVTNDPEPALIAFLRDRRLLIVLDSCEHVVEAAARLAEGLLTACPGVRILATSREALRADGERLIHLPPLAVPSSSDRLTPAVAVTYPAVELFVERTAASVDEFELTDANTPAVADICRRLDGVALAIELAAGRINAFGVYGVAKRLDDRMRLLTRGSRTALKRHQALGATLDWSCESLTDPERMVLRRLAVFVGGFTLEAASAVVTSAAVSASDVPDLIADLVAKSLVIAETDDRSGSRFRFLDTTRAYALAKLSESGELDEIAQRHAIHYRSVFERATEEWQTRPPDEWVSLYGREIDNVRASLRWAFSSAGDSGIGADLTLGVVPLWFHLSLTDECRSGVEQALASLRPGPDREARSRQVMGLYAMLGLSRTFTKGLAPEAAVAWTKALEVAEELNDSEHQLGALWGLWACRLGTGDFRAALAVAAKFAALARRTGSTGDLPIGDRMLGAPLHYLGEHVRARRYVERMLQREAAALPRSPSIRARFDQPVAGRAVLAHMLWLQGFPDQAVQTARKAVEEAIATSHAISICDALAQAAGPVALLVGDRALAEQSVSMLLDRAGESSLESWHVLGRCLQGELLVRYGDLAAGLALLRAALEDLREVRFAPFHTGFLGALAEGLSKAGQHDAGRSVVDGAIRRAQRREEGWCLAELLRIKAVTVFREGGKSDRREAERLARRSLEVARKQNALSWQLRAATSLARICRGGERHDEVRRLLGHVLRRFAEGHATADLKAAEALLNELA
jgi:predicted ATPase/DNA-binding winged helix-turn-helix (wHTH) protein